MGNAIELYHADGKSAGVYYCEKCRRVSQKKEHAEKCCKPTKCRYCGKDSGGKDCLACPACERKNEAIREAARFEKANGWVCHETIVGMLERYRIRPAEKLIASLREDEEHETVIAAQQRTDAPTSNQ